MTVGTFTEYEHMTEEGNCGYENRQTSEVSSENDITYDITWRYKLSCNEVCE